MYVNTEVSNEKEGMVDSKHFSNKHSKNKSYVAKSINFEQKIEHSLFRPQTSKHKNTKNNFLVKSHTPKSSSQNLNCNLSNLSIQKKNFHNQIVEFDEKEEVKKNFFSKLKELQFYKKNDEIIENFIFFENMKNFCELNFYSSSDDSVKGDISERNINSSQDEDIYNLILLNLQHLENNVIFNKKSIS